MRALELFREERSSEEGNKGNKGAEALVDVLLFDAKTERGRKRRFPEQFFSSLKMGGSTLIGGDTSEKRRDPEAKGSIPP